MSRRGCLRLRPRQRLLPVLLAVLVFLSQTAMSTITIAESGQHFASNPDSILGERLADGYIYMARIQYIPQNRDLCPSSTPGITTAYNITLPPDGLPVALLARGGSQSYCSDLAKARMVSLNIFPKHVVKYLIIYDADVDVDTGADVMQPYDRNTIEMTHRQTVIEETRATELPPRYTKDIDVYILHTSSTSGNDILNIILNQEETEKSMGGPRVLLDGRSAKDEKFKNMLLGIGIALMISGCMCSFLLSIRLNDLLGHEGAHAQNAPRDPRRQLTMEQVDEMVPSTFYHQDDEEEEEVGNACSICLDEFMHGDAIRQLPCHHVFHEDCVGKWLTERSSTCPLCKLDLLQPPAIPEEDVASTRVEQQHPSFWQTITAWWGGTSDSSSISMQGAAAAAQPLLDDYQGEFEHSSSIASVSDDDLSSRSNGGDEEDPRYSRLSASGEESLIEGSQS